MFFRTKDFQSVIQGKKYQMKYKDAKGSLVITDVMGRDVGRYTCAAANQYGHASTSAELKVKCKYMIINMLWKLFKIKNKVIPIFSHLHIIHSLAEHCFYCELVSVIA